MVARAWGDRADTRAKRERTAEVGRGAEAARRGVEERFVQNEAVSVCLLLNRRTKTMRVVDFRAGPSHAKRIFVMKLAMREGIEKVYTLVERDEVSTWMKLGFAKEGNIPGFYKRSDAFMLGAAVDPSDVEPDLRVPIASDDDDDEPAPASAPSPSHDIADKTLVRAKKQVKALTDGQLPASKVSVVREADVKKAIDKALRSGRAMTAFEPFGRDVMRRWFLVTSRGGFELVASIESQACFGNAFLELLSGPKSQAECLATVSALRALSEKLKDDGVVSCFALAPSDDIALATAFVWNGFRRTGLLQNHMVVGGERKDAIIWSRKLANPEA